jgi:hypothetical protein
MVIYNCVQLKPHPASERLSWQLLELSFFRCLSTTATEKTNSNKGRITNQENSGTVGDGAGEFEVVGAVGFGETELAGIVTVCAGLHSLGLG